MNHKTAIMSVSVPNLSPEKAARSFRAERIPLAPPLPDRDVKWRWGVAIIAALILHIAVVTMIDDGFERSKPSEPAPVPVEIVTEQPKPPPPPPEAKPVEKPPEPPKPPEQQKPPPLKDLHSGGDLEDRAAGAPPPVTTPTEKPPPATSAPTPPIPQPPAPTAAPALPNEASPQAVPVPPASSPRTTQQALTPPPLPAKKPPAPVMRESTTTAPPQPQNPASPMNLDLQLGEGGGDKYLTAMNDEIGRHIAYPPTAELFGIQGVAVYEIVINRQGQLLSVRLRQSSGYEILDKAGLTTVRLSAPFAPVPPDVLPGLDPIGLILTLPMP